MNKLFFMHIPKCGGTGIIQGFQKHYKPHNVFKLDAQASSKGVDIIKMQGGINEYRSGLLMYAMSSQQYNLITGHFLFDQRAYLNFGTQWKFITIVREPVSRFISHFFFNKCNDGNHFRIHDDIENYLNKPEAKELGMMVLKYFSGSFRNAKIEIAKDNINKFDIIGTLDNIDDFNNLIREKYGLELEVIHSNKNPKSIEERYRILTPAIIEKVKTLCEPDLELYNFLTDTYSSSSC